MGAIPRWEWPDLDAFERHTNQRFFPWEVEILEKLDDLFVAENTVTKTGAGQGA